MTILGELFGQQKRGKFVRLLLYDSAQMTRGCSDGMSKGVTDFLHQQGAFVLPPHKTCQKLLRLYFERVYPYTPVLNRVDFVCQYMNETYSTFLFQCILTSVAPYMSSLMLAECGYMDRASAQKSFFAKAQLLYDLDAEKSQVSLLQGSLILTSSYFAFGLDKDCRYWLANAVRLATQMGLHRKQIAEQLEPPAQELFARIFWVTFNKDVLMAISGRNNVRRLIDQHCDIAELRAEDFIEDDLTDHHHWRNILPTKTFLQHLYLVHNTTLSKLCARFISTVRVPSPVAQNYRPRDFEHELVQWRKALPYELRPESVTAWTHDNHWILVLRAMSYRFESVLWREERKLHDFDEGRTMLRKQQDAMLELDMILERFMLHNLVELCPFSM
ncbi:fungal-specific transcription factor domain-containing protein [Aspergillus carlsbadensis]|nr:fungal-specific transcription factor domain-containing protein [Aspergillus carlsbadensis]